MRFRPIWRPVFAISTTLNSTACCMRRQKRYAVVVGRPMVCRGRCLRRRTSCPDARRQREPRQKASRHRCHRVRKGLSVPPSRPASNRRRSPASSDSPARRSSASWARGNSPQAPLPPAMRHDRSCRSPGSTDRLGLIQRDGYVSYGRNAISRPIAMMATARMTKTMMSKIYVIARQMAATRSSITCRIRPLHIITHPVPCRFRCFWQICGMTAERLFASTGRAGHAGYGRQDKLISRYRCVPCA